MMVLHSHNIGYFFVDYIVMDVDDFIERAEEECKCCEILVTGSET